MSALKKVRKANIWGSVISESTKPLITLLIVIFVWQRYNDIIDFLKSLFNPDFKSLPTSSSTLTNSEALEISKKLFGAMRLPGYTDEQTINNSFKFEIKTKSNYNKVFNQFKGKRYNTFLGEHTHNTAYSKKNLTEWLNSELTNSEKTKINSIIGFNLLF